LELSCKPELAEGMTTKKLQILTHFLSKLWNKWQVELKSFQEIRDKHLRTGKEIRFRFWLSEDKTGKEAKRRPTGW